MKLEDASPGFFEFLEFLGEMIELKGWSGYNGELDTKLGTSGTHSLYTSYCGYEIMFHVAPFLPWRDNDPQQLGRKVRIGNDHLVIVYQEGDLLYDPTSLRSKQTHVICIVKPTDDLYWVNFFARASVPPFPPAWRFPVRLEKNRVSRDRLLEKCINGIKAMYGMPRFQTKLESYRRKMLWDVYGKSIANSHYVQRMGCPL
ncbi:hypothetical protein IWQ62_000478 [Dispira parvispora]|uniref:Rap-GAP domain-containing protein n=1 Tax=Dispira parvispora TaxID=1520584 RepID=A0A9W8E601_9FUNG|nr:hypothetical protein IWQ62_000478 [Dispira parvispora]